MIIKRLTLYNFGSYFKKTTIEFPESGFFLISGPTGSGKTTILEGISFALFGRVPRYGNSQEVQRELLAKNEETRRQRFNRMEVELEFVLNDEIYTVKRTVDFTLRGDKQNTIQRVELRNSNKVIAEKVTDYEKEISKIFGMESITKAYKTFTKSIFLPQNAFDTFLTLFSKEKKDIIFDLLNLNIYLKLKEKIKQKFQQLEKGKSILKEQKEYEENTLQKEEEKVNHLKSKIPSLKENIAELSEIIEKANKKVIILENFVKNLLGKDKNVIQETIAIQKELQKIQIIEAEKYLPQINDLEKKLSLNHLRFELLHRKYLDIQREIQNLKKLDLKLQDYFDVKNLFPDLRVYDLIGKIIELKGRLERHQESSRRISELQEKVNELTLKIEKIKHNIEKIQDDLGKLEEDGKEIDKDIGEKESELKDKRQKLDLKNKVLEIQKVIHHKNLDKCLVCYSDITDKNKTLIQKSLEKGKSNILESIQKLENQIEILKEKKKQLANDILENQKILATKNSEKEQKEYQINQLKREIIDQEKIINETAEFLKQNQDLLGKIKKMIYTIYKREGIDTKILEKLVEYLRDINALSGFVEKIKEYIDIHPEFEYLSAIEVEENALREDFERLNNGVSNLNQTIEEIKNLLRKFKMGDWEYIQKTISNEHFKNLHEKAYKQFEKLFSIFKHIKQKLELTESLKEKKQKLQDNLKTITFYTKEIIDSNFKPLGIDEEKERKIVKCIDSLSSVLNEKLDESNLEKILDEYQKLRIFCQEYKEVIDSYSKILYEVRVSLNNINNYKQKIEEIEKKLRIYQEEYEILNILREDFEENERRKERRSFLDFVYNTIVDMISHKTNSILNDLTEGRYSINFTDDLIVIDNWYGTERNIKSLSGGERFLASLSIAMAISELLSTCRYQVRSMFIDEGFGTLDEDTLNYVVDYLENYFYKQSDKVLGIITHVEEIKTRFNYVIKVNKTKNGSEVQIISNI
ncbi:MAG: SMC family ATPase [Candidatus Calescibacterium sp.]|nr:SMC family ATPase [Candidatus Calescibacterium sp.]MDW8194828.1 SMC family ATPase [Candidatus Calescibacterium sp.]